MMQIFDSENSIKNKVLANRTKAFVSAIKLIDDKQDDLVASLKSIAHSENGGKFGKVLAELSEHPDLMYGSAILVSTVMNENDDMFLPEDTWKARSTPINTPYNNNHEELKIIGHIIGARTLTKDGKVFADISDSPDYLDIEVDFVVYKSIYPAVAEDIYENGPKGKKFVSMEAIFDNFAYALIDSENGLYIIDRNKDTAFLTKYLRAYGGEGKYQEYRIGRVLKDFRFVGMGNVDEPANKASKYTNINPPKDSKQIAKSLVNKSFIIIKGKTMAKVIETLDEAKTVIAELNTKVETLEKGETSKAIETLKAEKSSLSDQVAAERAKIDTVTQELTKAQEKITSLETELTEAKKKADETKKENDDMKKKEKAAKRLTEIAEAGLDISTDEKKNRLLDMNDDAFASVLDFAKSSKKDDKKDKDKKDDKGYQKDGKAKSDAESAIDTAEKPKIPGTEVPIEQTQEEDINVLAQRVISSIMKKKTKATK